MDSQRRADDTLLVSFRQLAAILLLVVLLGIIAARYFGSLQQVADNGLQLEFNRLVNVVSMVRSQWLSAGRPKQLALDWQLSAVPVSGETVVLSTGGWPMPATLDAQGCRQLWTALLGSDPQQQAIAVSYLAAQCRYSVSSGANISYQLATGKVVFLTTRADP